jgi:hypothetical protein
VYILIDDEKKRVKLNLMSALYRAKISTARRSNLTEISFALGLFYDFAIEISYGLIEGFGASDNAVCTARTSSCSTGGTLLIVFFALLNLSLPI